MKGQVVAVNERGRRVGEDHHNAGLTNHEVDLLLAMRDEGCTYRFLADCFGISKSSVAMICRGERRCQVAMNFKTVEV